MTTRVGPGTVAIPASHLDLLTRPICGVLTTMGGDGQPQSSLVWVDWDGNCARVNTTLERQKGRNLLANPKVSLLVVDPEGRLVGIVTQRDLLSVFLHADGDLHREVPQAVLHQRFNLPAGAVGVEVHEGVVTL